MVPLALVYSAAAAWVISSLSGTLPPVYCQLGMSRSSFDPPVVKIVTPKGSLRIPVLVRAPLTVVVPGGSAAMSCQSCPQLVGLGAVAGQFVSGAFRALP